MKKLLVFFGLLISMSSYSQPLENKDTTLLKESYEYIIVSYDRAYSTKYLIIQYEDNRRKLIEKDVFIDKNLPTDGFINRQLLLNVIKKMNEDGYVLVTSYARTGSEVGNYDGILVMPDLVFRRKKSKN